MNTILDTMTTAQKLGYIKMLLAPVLVDSFGGIMYDVANQDKYDTTEIFEVWRGMSDAEQESADGIVKGAIDFLQGAI